MGSGGAEKVLLDVSIEFNKEKIIKSSVISFSDETRLLSEFKKNNIDIIVLYKKKSFIDSFKIIVEIVLYLRKNNIDVIHAHMSHAMMVSAILKIIFPKIKVIFTPHSINLGNILREVIIFLLKPFRSVDILFSKDMYRWFNKYNYKLIPNGVRVENFLINSKKFDQFTFIAIGNIKEAKNYLFLIECVYKLKKDFDFRLFIVGDGKDKILLDEKVSSRQLKNTVFIIGRKSNIVELLSKSHCLVVSSIWEGMPISILEAGASKIPIISTKVGSIPSILDDSCAYLSSLNTFANDMASVIQNYSEAEEKAENFYKKINLNYRIDQTAKSLEDLYKMSIK